MLRQQGFGSPVVSLHFVCQPRQIIGGLLRRHYHPATCYMKQQTDKKLYRQFKSLKIIPNFQISYNANNKCTTQSISIKTRIADRVNYYGKTS
jgi:hypothetical protein